jgi:hypothetical protein
MNGRDSTSDYLMNGTHAIRHWISWIGLRTLII